MRVHLGSDHAGFELKQQVGERLRAAGYEVVDHGPPSYRPGDDYPVYCLRAAAATVDEPDSLGVVIGGSGNGEQISANKVRGVRAALAWSEETARLARQHNNANVVAVGARMHPVDEAIHLVEIFLAEPFSFDPRHERRIAMLTAYETTGALPDIPGDTVGSPPPSP
ncbi:MAG TPA: ribose-5-phosphate isomerase [Kineosporiaceae bacterium]|nr:ribose-5-phosphate isomerase [Kineosporiaceae bacterium]